MNGAEKVLVVNPGNELLSGAGSAAQTKAYEPQQGVENAVAVGAHNHGAAQRNFAGRRSLRSEEFFFPAGGYVNAEPPSRWSIRFVVADFASGFVHGAIEGGAVDGCCAGVHPNFGRARQAADGFADQASCTRSGFFDFAPIGFVVAAIDIAAREIQDKIGVLKLFGPA